MLLQLNMKLVVHLQQIQLALLVNNIYLMRNFHIQLHCIQVQVIQEALVVLITTQLCKE